MTVTKAELYEAVFRTSTQHPRAKTIEAVEVVFETLKETLERGENVKLTGFGNFRVRDKSTRLGRNPKTGEPMKIPARRVVTFKGSPILRTKMNGKTVDK